MTTTFENNQDKCPRHALARCLMLLPGFVTLAFCAVLSTSCGKTTYIQSIPLDPVKTLTDHGFSNQSIRRAETRNADGSVEVAWQGAIVSSKPNDWEVLPGLWRNDIESSLGFKPDEKFPSSEVRKSGEPFEGSLSWTYNSVRAEMQITLKQESSNGVAYQISYKGQMVRR